jgi:single-strand DNA-binding protein
LVALLKSYKNICIRGTRFLWKADKLDQWDDKQTGAKRSKLKVIAESMQFVGPRLEAPAPVPSAQQPGATAPAAPSADIELEDIPF